MRGAEEHQTVERRFRCVWQNFKVTNNIIFLQIISQFIKFERWWTNFLLLGVKLSDILGLGISDVRGTNINL